MFTIFIGLFQSDYAVVLVKTTKDWQDWDDHLKRLEQLHTSGNYDGVKYQVVFRLVDAADYGITQQR
ncbi:hypothetical protein [Moorena sp. SIO3B2]|uniref:hypothetical protein n=1 Tax=Moorena sp. SIO3B2 TaxID=2607827 RepID=UPI0013C9ED9E|nr:hypothetical protein [Moorena sp. SIO3B2]NEP31534.1 hypothetical protein [Moorena sp. SIO3B2]